MKWHYFNITIAAALLISLPFRVMSAHCDEEAWNTILNQQSQVDQTYNLHAQRFNQFLSIHQNQPFLYQEFTSEEIRRFWHSNKDELHQSMKEQIQASLFVIEQIQQERINLQSLTSRVTVQAQRWQVISQHCRESDNPSNAIASWNYSLLNHALNRDINLLLTKLATLEQRYNKEVEALNNAKPMVEE